MKKKLLIYTCTFCIALLPHTLKAQSFGDVIGRISKNADNKKNNGGNSINSLSSTEIVRGLKEALETGAQNATSSLSKKNGFFGNQIIKILLPPEVRTIESKLRQFGLGSVADKVILSMNQAAEDAAGKALPILVNAVTSLTIQDGVSILKGNSTAATDYLQTKTTLPLTEAFRPVISQSLNKYNVEQLWKEMFTTYNRLPIIKNKVNSDLTAYVTEKTLGGLFYTIGQEEKKIRANPAGTANDIIQKVFGAK